MASSTIGTCNLNQWSVARGVGDVSGLPAAAMTGCTVASASLAGCTADPDTGCGVVTSRTGVMGIGGGTDQSVVMARTTGGACDGDHSAVIWCGDVGVLPGVVVTSRTVASTQQGLTDGQTAEAAVCIMTAGTSVMGLGCSAVEGVVVTAVTAGCGNLNQVAVVRNVGCVGCVKVVAMTAGAITTGTEVLTNGQADQSTVNVMTAGAGIVHLRIAGIGQWWRIIVTVATAGRSDLNQAVVAWKIAGMSRFPAIGVTGFAIAAASWNTSFKERNSAVTEVTFT